MQQFFAIGGHCTTETRIFHAIGLINSLRSQWPRSFISFSSHIPVDSRIQELCDLCLVDKNNIMGNVDFENAHTKQYKHYFWELPIPGFNLEKKIPYHQYANHRQYHDLSLILLKLYNAPSITFFTYDCQYDVVNEIEYHHELLKEYDAIFYEFFVPGNSVNTEFFTLSADAIKKSLWKIFGQDEFFSFDSKEEFTLEQIYYSLMNRENISYKILPKRTLNHGRFGVMAQHDRSEHIEKSLLNPQHPDVQLCPFLDWSEGRSKMLVMGGQAYNEQEDYEIKLEFRDESNNINEYVFQNTLAHSAWVFIDKIPGYPIVHVYKNDELLFIFDLSNPLNYGLMKKTE